VFDFGFSEMVVVAILVLVFVGPDRIPEMMSVAGRYYAKVRRASDELRRAFNTEVARYETEYRRQDFERRRAASARADRDEPEGGSARPGKFTMPGPGSTTIPPEPSAPAPVAPAQEGDGKPPGDA
jgi:sec-independent protein translocase protein TatB